jgi:hypothetical protein
MSYEELQGWLDYFEKRPPDWRSDDRTFKVLQTQGVKEKPWAIFPTLDPIYNRKTSDKNAVDSLKSSAMFLKMSKSVGGERLSL